MADSYELRKGARTLNVIEDDLAAEIVAAVARDRLEEDLASQARVERDREAAEADDSLGCDC
jgi:hypothetical protein